MNGNNENMKKTTDDSAEKARKSMDDAMQAAKSGTEKASAAAHDASQSAMDSAQSLGENISSRASETMSAVRESASERLGDAAGRIGQARDALSDSGDRLAETLNRAAEDPQAGRIKSTILSSAASGVSTASHAIRDRGLSEIASDIKDLARRHPAAFAAGAAVAGFALARFLRSSSQHSRSDFAQYRYGDEHRP